MSLNVKNCACSLFSLAISGLCGIDLLLLRFIRLSCKLKSFIGLSNGLFDIYSMPLQAEITATIVFQSCLFLFALDFLLLPYLMI